jgi:hypothetical protein
MMCIGVAPLHCARFGYLAALDTHQTCVKFVHVATVQGRVRDRRG